MAILAEITTRKEDNHMCNIRRLRSTAECLKWLKEQDPDTGITAGMIRDMAKSGDVPCVWRGRKVLIDIDALPDAIAAYTKKGSCVKETKIVEEYAEIKPISGRYGKARAI